MPIAQESRSRRTDQRYYGVAEAIVTDVNDPEKEGRIKVRYPWFDDDTESGWVRVRQLYAGNGYGTFFIPEVDDEVLVAFVHGDMRQPIVLGGLYNGNDKPSVYRDDSNDPKLIRTKGGQQILLDDSEGAEKIEIVDKEGNTVLIDAVAKTITVEADMDITVKSKSGNVTVEASSALTLKGKTISIEATGSVTVKGSSINLN
jgi:phage baseplate assembly protein V